MRKFINKITSPNYPPIAIMAEIKLRSPSQGILGSATDLLPRAKSYAQVGADVISCITESRRFGGNPNFIPLLKKHIHLPILQKDFVTTKKQVYQARKLGSDALLLIANLVPPPSLKKLVDLCLELNIEPVVEVFNQTDLEKAIQTPTNIIAVNARNLTTFAVNVPQACKLIKKIPPHFIKLGFSGIHGPQEVHQYKQAGANGVLVGTSLMKATDVNSFITNLRSV